MRGHRFTVIVSALSAIVMQGCVILQPPAERPGINRREMDALVQSYYWQRNSPVPSYTPAELSGLLRALENPRLDGESAELAFSRVVLALAVVGDEAFAKALSQQSAFVRKRLSRDLPYLWPRYQLKYPRTRNLLLKIRV